MTASLQIPSTPLLNTVSIIWQDTCAVTVFSKQTRTIYDSSVHTATVLLAGQPIYITVRLPNAIYFSLQTKIQSKPVANPASCSTGTRGTFEGEKTAVTLSYASHPERSVKANREWQFPFVHQWINSIYLNASIRAYDQLRRQQNRNYTHQTNLQGCW